MQAIMTTYLGPTNVRGARIEDGITPDHVQHIG